MSDLLKPAGDRLKNAQSFTQIPNEIIRGPWTPQAKTLWSILWSYCYNGNDIFPGMNQLSDDMNMHVNSVRNYRKELEKAGLLEVARRGRGDSNVYSLYAPDLQYSVGGGLQPSVEQDLQYVVGEEYEVNNTNKNNKSMSDKGKHKKPTPTQFQDYWNEKLPEHLQITRMTTKRKEKLKTRRQEELFRSDWKTMICLIADSDFLTGTDERSFRGFDVNWVLENDDNYVKILEGKYNSGPRRATRMDIPSIDRLAEMGKGEAWDILEPFYPREDKENWYRDEVGMKKYDPVKKHFREKTAMDRYRWNH